MCGRFTLTARDIDEAARAFEAEVAREDAARYRPRWNVAPTDGHWVVLLDPAGKRRMVAARFGFERPDGRLVVNARSETAAALPTFRKAFVDGRCLVPVDGFYEWQGSRSERRQLWFHDRGGKPFAFAGLAEERAGPLSFVILTTAANELLRPVHERMPVVLSPGSADAWLARGEVSLLAPAPESWLVAQEVSPAVSSVANDGPELLESQAPERQLRLL